MKINDPNHPVILFIPEIGIYPFARGLAVLGDVVKRMGGRVLVTHDTGQMIRSPLMSMNNMPALPSKKDIYTVHKVTEKYFKKVIKTYDFEPIELKSIVDDSLLRQINDLVDKNRNRLNSVKYLNFPIGKMAEYDFILESKFPFSNEISDEHKVLYSQFVKNAALALEITNRICDKYRPSLILTFNEYAQCQSVRYGAELNNVRRMALTYPVHLNIDASKYSIWDKTYDKWRYRHCSQWHKYRDMPISQSDVINCWKDSVYRMYESGSHIFSVSKSKVKNDLAKKLILAKNKKTIIVYTSSEDERRSVEVAMEIWGENADIKDVFPNQITWLTKLKSFAKGNKDVQFVVRIHPREGVRQHGIESKHLQLLRNEFKQDSDNFKIIWPDDPVSSYDLMELADVCLVAWSIIGQEAARLCIPVLTYTSNMFYQNDEFLYVARTEDDYFNKLNKLLSKKQTLENLILAIRYYHWRTFIPAIDLSETVPNTYDDKNIWPRVQEDMVDDLYEILAGKKDLINYNIDKWLSRVTPNSFVQEKLAVKYGIRYFLDKLLFSPLPSKNESLLIKMCKGFIIRLALFKKNGNNATKGFTDYDLRLFKGIRNLAPFIKETKENVNLRIFVSYGSFAKLIYKGNIIKTNSKMAIRLAQIHSEIPS